MGNQHRRKNKNDSNGLDDVLTILIPSVFLLVGLFLGALAGYAGPESEIPTQVLVRAVDIVASLAIVVTAIVGVFGVYQNLRDREERWRPNLVFLHGGLQVGSATVENDPILTNAGLGPALSVHLSIFGRSLIFSEAQYQDQFGDKIRLGPARIVQDLEFIWGTTYPVIPSDVNYRGATINELFLEKLISEIRGELKLSGVTPEFEEKPNEDGTAFLSQFSIRFTSHYELDYRSQSGRREYTASGILQLEGQLSSTDFFQPVEYEHLVFRGELDVRPD